MQFAILDRVGLTRQEKLRLWINWFFQRTQRGANLQIRWALAIARFDLGPGDFSSFVDHVNRRMRNAIDFLAFVSGIAQPIGVDDFMSRVREQWEIDCAFTIGSNLLSQVFANVWRINADRVELYVLTLLQQRT